MDEAMLAEVRQANAAYLASYERRLAEEIVTMLPNSPDDAREVLRVVDVILNLEVPRPAEPPPSEPHPDAA